MSRHLRIRIDKNGWRRATRPWAIGVLLGVSVLVAGWGIWRQRDHRAFPKTHWDSVSPRAAGFDNDRLQALSRRLGGDGCIVYKGRMLHTWGEVAELHDVASAAKPFYTHFTLKAIEENLIESLDNRVVTWVPELATLNADLDFKDREITFRHLLDQTSGYGLSQPPGTAFGYNDYQTGLLVWTLFRRVYACGYDKADEMLLNARLGRDLLFEDQPTFSHRSSRPGRLRISARDLARFGHLYLMRGQWRGRPVLREDLAHLAVNSPLPVTLPRTAGKPAERLQAVHSIGGGLDQTGHAGAHSFYWWLNRQTADGNRLLPDAPALTFMTAGHGGHAAMLVIPEHDLVVVWMDAFASETLSPFDEVGRLRVNDAVRELLDARSNRTRH